MKLNWGLGITIAIIAFMGFILFMVFQATSTKHDLQAEDYYAQEINYQEKIDALRNGDQFKDSVRILQTESHVELKLPSDLLADDNSLKVEFLRPNDASLDKSFHLSSEQPIISKDQLFSGEYKLTLYWSQNQKYCAIEQQVTVRK